MLLVLSEKQSRLPSVYLLAFHCRHRGHENVNGHVFLKTQVEWIAF